MSAYRRAEIAIEKYMTKKSLDSDLIDFDYCLIEKCELVRRFDEHLNHKDKRVKTLMWDDGDWEEPSTRIYIFLYEDDSEVLIDYDDVLMADILSKFEDTFIIQADIEEHVF